MTEFNYDIDRLKRAVESGSHRVPLGLSPEELRSWMKHNSGVDMTEEQQAFYQMIEGYPCRQFWNDRNGLDTKGLIDSLEFMSPGECHMARFFAGVWLGDDIPTQLRFNLTQAMKTLDGRSINMIAGWMQKPLWP